MNNSPRRETAGGFSVEAMQYSRHAHTSARLIRTISVSSFGSKGMALPPKFGLARAVLGWSQTELGTRIGLTQRAIHKLEQGETEPRRATVQALQAIWREQNIEFEELTDGGFRVIIRSSVLDRAPAPRSRRGRATRTRLGGIRVHRTRKSRS